MKWQGVARDKNKFAYWNKNGYMKVNELMINDWADGGRKYPVKVFDLERDGINASKSVPNDFFAADGFINEKDLKPLALWEKYLKPNGFYLTPSGWTCKKLEEKSVFVDSSAKPVWGGASGAVVFGVHAVHELQHVMRMCGLCEQADNFKLNGE